MMQRRRRLVRAVSRARPARRHWPGALPTRWLAARQSQERGYGAAALRRARALLGRAVEKLVLSARAARRVLKVARTIADLDEQTRVGSPAVAEALGFRDGTEPG